MSMGEFGVDDTADSSAREGAYLGAKAEPE